MLLILGLDGATLDLVEPWIADGTLPNLARLRRDGRLGRLASTVPAATFPSWTTFMTGVNPGRHGVFDFTRREPGAYRVRFVNATFRKAPTVWRLLSDAGRRVSVLGLPGHVSAGADQRLHGQRLRYAGDDARRRQLRAPARRSPTRSTRAGGFPFADFQEFHIGPGWHARALRQPVRRHRAQGAARRTAAGARALGLLHAALRRVRHRGASLLGVSRPALAALRRGAARRRSATRCAPSTRRSTTRSAG